MAKKSPQFDGILFIGDPHAWSKTPGKRTDKDFPSVVLDKLDQSIQIALEQNLYPIILGDLFHDDKENNIQLLTRMVKVFKRFPLPIATIEGNHEKSQVSLSEDVAAALLKEAGVLHYIHKNKIEMTLKLGSKNVHIGSTPYGSKIPEEIILKEKSTAVPKGEDDFVIWLTHDNLDFGDSYPGVIRIREIKGCDMLVNGHIHKKKDSVVAGEMVAHNPGNITRLSIDCKDHVPAVWVWKPELGKMIEPIPLRYEKDVFDEVGKQIVVPQLPEQIREEITQEQSSKFLSEIKSGFLEEKEQTDDGEEFKGLIRVLAKALNVDKEFEQEILGMADEVIANESK